MTAAEMTADLNLTLPYGKLCTLWCQLEDTVLLIGTLLLFDPVLFPKYEE